MDIYSNMHWPWLATFSPATAEFLLVSVPRGAQKSPPLWHHHLHHPSQHLAGPTAASSWTPPALSLSWVQSGFFFFSSPRWQTVVSNFMIPNLHRNLPSGCNTHEEPCDFWLTFSPTLQLYILSYLNRHQAYLYIWSAPSNVRLLPTEIIRAPEEKSRSRTGSIPASGLRGDINIGQFHWDQNKFQQLLLEVWQEASGGIKSGTEVGELPLRLCVYQPPPNPAPQFMPVSLSADGPAELRYI